MTDMSPGINPGRGGNGSLHWTQPPGARNPRVEDGAPSKDGQIEFDIAFDVNNFLILITLAIVLAIYIAVTLLLLVKRWWGGRVPLYILKWPPSNIKSTNPYVVTIVTGFKKDAGTDGTLVFSIHGFNYTSEQCFINGGMVHRGHKLLNQGGSDAFLITCDEPLGNIAEASVTLWAMDPDEKWYLRHITIQDIKRNVFTYLPLHKWVYASKGGGEVLIIEARNKTCNQFLDNIICAFRERNVWIAPWLSTILGSKLDSVFSVTLCYLTVTCFMFAAVVFFYISPYEQHSNMAARMFIFAVVAAIVITCCVTALHTAMRLIRLRAGDFVNRYSPVLLRDLSVSPHVHWDLDSDRTDSDSSNAWRESGSDGLSGKRQERLTDLDANAQWNNSNRKRFGGPWGERKHLKTQSSYGRVLADRQSNNNNRSGICSSKGDVFQAFPSSSFRVTDDSRSNFITCGDDASAIRDNFTKTRFPGSCFTSPCKPPPTGISSPCRSTTQGSSFPCRPRTANPMGSWRLPSRSNSGFGICRSPATSIKVASRRYDSYMNLPDNGKSSAWPSVPPQRSSCLKNTNSDCDFPLFAQGMSMSTGAAPTTRCVAFKYPLDDDDDDGCSKCFAKTSNSDTNRTLFGCSLPRSDSWKTPCAPACNDSRFSSRRCGPSSRIRSNARDDAARIFRSRCAYDDAASCGPDDTSQTQDYIERSFSRGVASTKKFSFPKQTVGVASDRFCSIRAASDPCYGRTPTISPSLQKAITRMANESLQSCEAVEQDNANVVPCECSVQDCDQNPADEVERSWNALWDHVKPRDDGYGASKDGSNGTDGSRTASAVNCQIKAELRGFAGKLVESIIAKIKKQLTSPDECVDLADCEFDIESFVRRMSQRMATEGVTDFGCGGGSGCRSDLEDPCASSFPDCSGASDMLTDRLAQTVTDGALKSSLSILDERVSAIVKDVEKVRVNIMKRMRQELGLGPEDDGKDFRSSGRHLGMSASDTSVTMMTRGKTDKLSDGYLPSDDILPTMTDEKLAKVARSSLDDVLNRDGMDNIRDTTKTAAEGDLKNFATDVVQSLYMAVRTKLQQMLKHEYDLADDGTVPFPTEELLKKADHEVQEQVLPTVVEHIVWLMKEEAKVMGQLDCDMMMIAFAGQYVDTIVTNAVLKTHVDLARKRAYTRTFVVTSNSNKTNSNNNQLSLTLDRCISESTLSMETLASLSATRLEVEEVLRDGCSYGHVEAELAQLQILCSLVDKFITRLRGVRRTARSETVTRVRDGDPEEATEEKACPHCRAEAARRVVAKCLTPLSAKLITDLILEEATKNLDACGRIVESNLTHCNQETMVALGRALLDGSCESGDDLLILESVTADLKAMALDRATAKVVDDLMAIGDASRAEAESGLRRKLNEFMDHAKKNTEKMMVKTAIRENHQQNNSHFQIDFYPRSENINYNAAAAAASEAEDGGRSFVAVADGLKGEGIPDSKGRQDNPDSDAMETEDSDDNPNQYHPDADHVMDEMIGIRNSLTRIADEDECLTGRCRRHRGRLSRTLRSSRCENLHYGEFIDGASRNGKPLLTEMLAGIEGCTLSDLWTDPNSIRHLCLVFLGRLLFAFVLFLVASFGIGCVVLGLRLSPSQAGLWLQLAGVGTALHALLIEPIKVFALAVYWTVFRNNLMQ